MAYDPGPPPKRKEYLTEGTWWIAKNRWKQANDAWRAEQRRQQQAERQQAGRLARTIVTGAVQVYGALTNPGLASGALPGHQGDAEQFGDNWKSVSQQEQRDWQSRELENGTRDAGNRRGWSSGS